MKAKLVKFADGGDVCNNDINYLRRHPECGIPFIQDKPFKPDDPKHKFRPYDRNFSINTLSRNLPKNIDIPPPPPIGQPTLQAKLPPDVASAYMNDQYLPQDYTNYQQGGRRLIGEHLEYDRSVGQMQMYGRLPTTTRVNDIPNYIPRIGNTNYSHETRDTENVRPVGDVELEDFGTGVGNVNQRPPPINLTDPITPHPTRRPGQFDEDIVRSLEAQYNAQRQRLTDEGKTPEFIERFIEKNKRDFLNRRNQKMRERLNDPAETEFLAPRGMTEEELINLQIEQLSRNLPQEEAKQVERSIRKSKGKGKGKAKPTDQEMFPIESENEELVFLKEIDKILKPGVIDLTIQQKNNLVQELLSRGFSRERINELLYMYEMYDPVLEQAIGGTSRETDEERLLRRLRSGIREMPVRDTNLLPERQTLNENVELREDTPLTRGRTDIARGRSRVEKVYDKVAGKLPEELRTLAGSVKRNAEAFNQNVRTKSLEAIQRVRATSTRVFGQEYAYIRETAQLEQFRGLQELGTETGTIKLSPDITGIRPPATEDITGLRVGDIMNALDFDPLGEDTNTTLMTTGARPKLTYAERLQRVKAGALSSEAGIGGAGAVGGVLIGFGVAELMSSAGVDNKYAIATTAGGVGGAGARILTMAGTRALTRGTTSAVAETATYTAIRGGTSLLRGAAEGAVIGIALMPVDMFLNDAFVNSGMKHWEANLSSGAIVGGTAAAVSTIGLASLGAAPETLGASLVVGGLAIAATEIIGLFTGLDQDRKERDAKRKAEKAISHLKETGSTRTRLLMTLPMYGYDFEKALAAFRYKDNLGIHDDTWDTFLRNTGSLFVPRPNNTPYVPPSGEPPDEEQKRINDLFGKYITHHLIARVCSGDTGCEELRRNDQGDLTSSEVKFLNDKTASTWLGQANMQVEASVQELHYTRKRVGDAQLQMLNAWNNDQKIANQLDPYIIQTAQLDPTFRQRYDLAIKLDAEQKVVDAYLNNQTKINELPKNIRDMANIDPDFDNMINVYYNTMENTSGQLDISVPQLIQLQGLTGEEQKDKYQEFQFDNIKEDRVIVAEAKEIANEEDQVREAGFYDLDQAFLETDPTAITTWHPSDSQILQAHSAGMNLNEYVMYMHQLPKYTENELRASGILDYTHFQDELQLAGYGKDTYLYNPETRQFTLNPNVSSIIPSTFTSQFTSQFTPRYLSQAREEYGDMIHGLNEKNQNQVDNYNTNLMRELSSYGKHYDSIVADINNETLYEGRSDLLYYDIGKVFNQNKIEFNPMSDKLQDAPTGRQLAEQTSPVTEPAAPQANVTYVPGLVGTDTSSAPLPTES